MLRSCRAFLAKRYSLAAYLQLVHDITSSLLDNPSIGGLLCHSKTATNCCTVLDHDYQQLLLNRCCP